MFLFWQFALSALLFSCSFCSRWVHAPFFVLLRLSMSVRLRPLPVVTSSWDLRLGRLVLNVAYPCLPGCVLGGANPRQEAGATHERDEQPILSMGFRV